MLFSAAVVAAAGTFTACEREIEEVVAPEEALQASTENGAIIPGQYIVVFKETGTLRLDATVPYAERVDAVRNFGKDLLAANGVQEVAIAQAYGKAIMGVAARLSESEVEALRRDSRVAYIEPDRMMVLGKPSFAGGGGKDATVQETPWGITRVGSGVGTGTGKIAWVIDTGIDQDHPDLNVNTNLSYSVFTTGRDATPDDGNGHGTHVAGTIAAIDNEIGVIGVAHGATVVAVKVLDSRGSGSYSGVIKGVDYVAGKGKSGDVANMSLGGPVSQALDDAITRASAKVKFALAAGNDGADANNSSPARVNGTNIYTISAIDVNDKFASWSNWGNPPVDYAAPGVGVKSTWKDGGYNTISGTSMATPHVAGLLLLGAVREDGFASGDPDRNPDPIAHTN